MSEARRPRWDDCNGSPCTCRTYPGNRTPEERERGRWLAWLAEIGYGVDFTNAPPPPCTPRELAGVYARIDGESVEDWAAILLDGNTAGGWYGNGRDTAP